MEAEQTRQREYGQLHEYQQQILNLRGQFERDQLEQYDQVRDVSLFFFPLCVSN